MDKYFENELTYNRITFNLCNEPRVSDREVHSHHEILLYFNGPKEFVTKEGQRILKDNSLLLIPRDTYHYIKIGEAEFFTRLKICIPTTRELSTPLPALMTEFKVFERLNDGTRRIFNRLYDILQSPRENAAFHAYAAFLMLVAELDRADHEKNTPLHTKNSKLMIDVMDYISDNLSADLSIKALAEQFHISSSGLTHLFKKQFAISIHKFITQKRLIYAKEQIINGSQPTKLYKELGFKNYSSFYKTYCQFFGYPPSNRKRM